jgi:hypothetical protein
MQVAKSLCRSIIRKSRHLGFDVFKAIWSMDTGQEYHP